MSRRTVAILAILLIAAAFALGQWVRRDEPEPEIVMPEPRILQLEDIVAYGELEAYDYRVRSTRDVLPGGYSAAMAPLMVDWQDSKIDNDGFVVLRNINDGGNPLSGVTRLRSGRVEYGRIAEVQFILVPLGGPAAVSHGQLRFVFEKGAAEFLGDEDEGVVGEPDRFEDLVLSWEAWRPPGVDYDVLQGMSEERYKLSMRGYTGRQRFLEDALADRGWKCFTLKLPGGSRGLTQLLLVSLAMGDGSARAAIGEMLDRAEQAWLADGPSAPEEEKDAVEQWMSIRDEIARRGIHPEDERLDGSRLTSYQSLVRSCASLALYMVDVSVQRLIEQGVSHDGMQPTKLAPVDDVPTWMSELADANLAGVFARAPSAIRFFSRYPTAIPGEIPKALDAAGLLVRENGKAVEQRFSIDAMTPWGHRDQLLIR